MEKENQMLRLVSKNRSLIIDACDGTKTLMKATKTFKRGIDYGSGNWNCKQISDPTKETEVEIYEQIQEATFIQMFSSLSNNWEDVCLTQHQIEVFCNKHSTWLVKDTVPNLMLFKVEENFLIALVNTGMYYEEELTLAVKVRWFSIQDIWKIPARGNTRIIVPKISV